MDDNLNIWLNGQPVLSDTGLGDLGFWLDGQPYYMESGEEPPVPPVSYIPKVICIS
jgi:hypothetical protein